MLGPKLTCLGQCIDVFAGEGDKFKTGEFALQFLDGLRAVLALHDKVGDDQIGGILTIAANALLAAVGYTYFVANLPQEMGQCLSERKIVVYDENAFQKAPV